MVAAAAAAAAAAPVCQPKKGIPSLSDHATSRSTPHQPFKQPTPYVPAYVLCVRSAAIFVFAHFYFPASGQAVVTGVVPSSPRFLPSIFIAHRVQQSHCSSIFHRVLLTRALALSASQFVRKKKSPRIYTSMPSGGFELTKLTCTRLEDNLIRPGATGCYISCHGIQNTYSDSVTLVPPPCGQEELPRYVHSNRP